MKKKLLIFVGILAGIFFIFLIFVIVFSFTVVKPNVDSLSRSLGDHLSNVVRTPEQVSQFFYDFNGVSLMWEMETNEKEIVPVKFFYSLSIPPQDKEIIATLEMGPGGDPSVFEKVLPALIADEKSLLASQKPQESNLRGSEKALYSSISLAQDIEKAKTVKITWVIDKENLNGDLKNKYKEVNSFPPAVTRVLYSIPSLVIAVLGG